MIVARMMHIVRVMNRPTRPEITLSAAHTDMRTWEEFNLWVDYVVTHIDEECGFTVDVYADADALTPDSAHADEIVGATSEQREIIEEAIQRLWDRGCADSFEAAAETAVQS